MADIGHRRWAVAEGYIPQESVGLQQPLVSHETLCVLNADAPKAHVSVAIYFADRDLDRFPGE